MVAVVNIIWGPLKSLVRTIAHPMKVPMRFFFTRPFALMSFHPKVTEEEDHPQYLVEHNYRFRGLIGIDMTRCTGCRRCERVCPNKIIRMVPRTDEQIKSKFPDVEPNLMNKKHVHPEIYFGRCLFCGYCGEELVGGCPYDSLNLTNLYDISEVFDDNLIFTPEKLQMVVEKVGRGTQNWWTKPPEKPKPKPKKVVKPKPAPATDSKPTGTPTPASS